MGFFIGMFICNLLIPLIMLIAGFIMYKNPPKEINLVMGYRTRMSMKNKDTWAFAHRLCGRLWMICGAVLLILTVIAQIPFIHAGDHTIGIMTAIVEGVQLVVLIGSIVPVEIVLHKTFDKEGKRKGMSKTIKTWEMINGEKLVWEHDQKHIETDRLYIEGIWDAKELIPREDDCCIEVKQISETEFIFWSWYSFKYTMRFDGTSVECVEKMFVK